MAVTTSGTFFLTLQKFLNGSTVVAWDNAACKYALGGAEASSTPDFSGSGTAWDFRVDIDELPNGNGYATGGDPVTTPSIAVPGIGAGNMSFDFDNPEWTSSTLTTSHGVHCSGDATNTLDEINFLQFFNGDVTTAGGTLTVTIDATNGAWYIT